ncbi:hypothetical protein VTO73DRAFT_11530 [Trametes versicolor]
MVAPTFILTRTFAISALFVGAFPVTYAAPVLTKAAAISSHLEPRFCRAMGCLYALPDADSSDAASNTTSTAAVTPSADASSALQVIDLLISALQSAASSLRQSSTAQTAISSVNAAVPAAVDAAEPVETDSLAAAIAAIAATAAPAIEAPSVDAQEDAPTPAVEVVGFSTVASTDVDTTAPA